MPQFTEHTLSATVWITTQFVGFHLWDDAPPHREYLRALHRHVFHVRVELSVAHDDREIEYHDLKDEVDGYIHRAEWGPAWSCEAMARDLLDSLRLGHPGREFYQVTVSEDGENGSTITAVPPTATIHWDERGLITKVVGAEDLVAHG